MIHLKGKYALHENSRSGENVTLWLGTEDGGTQGFYLEVGFYGDDGGKTFTFEGNYTQENQSIILQVNKEIERKWDDSIDYEEAKEKTSHLEIKCRMIQGDEIINIELEYEDKSYLLKRLEI